MAKLGFINPEMNTIMCSACKAKIKFKAEFNFTSDEEEAKKKIVMIKRAHFPDCIFKQQGEAGA